MLLLLLTSWRLLASWELLLLLRFTMIAADLDGDGVDDDDAGVTHAGSGGRRLSLSPLWMGSILESFLSLNPRDLP